MDTHVTTSPVFDDSPTLRARLPGEPTEGLSAEDARPPLHADSRDALPPAPRKTRRRLLAGVAIIAIVAVAGGGFLVSPYNTVVPVPPTLKAAASHAEQRFAALFQHSAPPPVHAPSPAPVKVAAAPSVAALPAPAPSRAMPGVVAPAAALAPIHVPPPPASVVLPAYKPAPQTSEMAELIDLQHGAGSPAATAPASPPVPTQSVAAHPAKSDAVSQPPSPVQAKASQADAPPPGYVAHEPGAAVATGPASPASPPKAKVADGSPIPAAKAPAPNASAVSPTVAPQAAASTPHAQPMHQIVVGPDDVLAISPKLEAAPMAPAQQIQVLEMVTQLATLIRDQRTEIANLQADVRTSQKATAAKLGDMERRLALVEAGSALAAASNAPASPAAAAPAASPSPSATTVALTSAKAALAAASAPAAAQAGTAASAPAQTSSGAPEQFRVQAASPGLAMLAEVDHSGGDGAQQEVQVGDVLPGYGRVLSVSQQGTSWVVKTEHGTIQ